MLRRAHTLPADLEATPDSITSLNHVLGTELLVKCSKEKTLKKTGNR